MDSSVSPTHGDREVSAWNGHFECTCCHPLFLFNQFGMLERCALRHGNVYSADGWRDLLDPVIARYAFRKLGGRFFRADAAYASPPVYVRLPLVALPTVLACLAAGFVLAMCGDALPDRNRRTLPRRAGLSLLASFAALGVGTGRSGFDAARPRPESVRYDLDAMTGAARWITNDPFLGGWSGQFIPAGTARLPDGVTAPGGLPTFAADAPRYGLSGPNTTLGSETGTVEGRHLRLMIQSPRAAPIIVVQVDADGPITAATIEGQSLDLATFAPAVEGDLSFYASAFAADGFTLELALIGDAEVRISLADMSDDLPGPPVSRPADTMSTPGATRDGTVVRTKFEF